MAQAQAIDKLVEHVKAWRNDARLFVREVFGVVPTPQQDLILEAISQPGAKVAVKSGHGTGKSTTASWIILWHTSLFSNSKTPATAPSGHQLSDVLWAEIAKWHDKTLPWLKDQIIVSSAGVSLKGAEKTQFAVARTARPERPEALQGFHADNLLFVIDEASGVAEGVFQVAQGALSTKNARVLMLGNPTQTSGYFYNAFHKRQGANWQLFTLNSEESPLVDAEYLADMEAGYGRDSDVYKVRVLGEFPGQSVLQLISTELIEESRKRQRPNVSYAPVILGVDVAREGDDRNVIVKRQGALCWILGVWQGIKDTQIMADILINEIVRHNPDAVFIDVGAAGPGVIDRVRALGHKVIEVNFGHKSTNPRYANKRTEMYFAARDWLQKDEGVLPDDDVLCDELKAPEFYFVGNDKIALERKKDIKKRLGFSPDKADAFVLTFAAPVAKKSENLGERMATTGKRHRRRE